MMLSDYLYRALLNGYLTDDEFRREVSRLRLLVGLSVLNGRGSA